MDWFDTYRPQKDKGNAEGEVEDGAGSDRRQGGKRQVQRRQFFRVVYPLVAAPEISNLPAKVVDISVRAVKLVFSRYDANNANFDIGSKMDISLKFHDGQTIEKTGSILRKETDHAGKFYVVCIFDSDIPSAVINKEESYLLKNFPDFCRDKFKF